MSLLEKLKALFGVVPVPIASPSDTVKTPPVDTSGFLFSEENNKILQLLLDMRNTGSNSYILFVTGMAGTGKTTLINLLRSQYPGHLAILAPTGIAALNAGGVTIHSFFKFPHRILTVNDIKTSNKRVIYEKLELLIIDEVSMVRCDLLDSIDRFLRMNRDSDLPFGGVQLLLIGDLFQLPPVVKDSDQRILRQIGHKDKYFFNALCLQGCELITIELKTVYRQRSTSFTDILKRIRVAEDIENTVNEVNQICYKEVGSRHSITLTCTNAVADEINMKELNRLATEKQTYLGSLTGNYNASADNLPSPYRLELKVGAQIMFTQNDGAHRWVNGSMGIVRSMDNDSIKVQLTGANNDYNVNVRRTTWEKYRYVYNHAENQIIPVTIGTYIQYPLSLAWAVTIHKSQGKTLDNILIDFGAGAFETGQVYVALSRCRTINDIRLACPLKTTDVKCDTTIKDFYATHLTETT